MVNFLRACRTGKAWSRAVALAAVALLGARAASAQVDTYTLTPSQGTFTPLTGGTGVSAVQVDDAVSAALPIGFSFTFDGTPYTQVVASSNGFLSFNATTTASSLTNSLAIGDAGIRPLVAPLWDDLHGGSGTASYLTTGTAPNRIFTFEWLNWRWSFSASSPVISFQVKLYEGTNRVEYIYRQEATAVSSGSASIGLSGVGTGTGSFLSLSDASATPATSSTTETTSISAKPATGQVYAFVPAAPAACPAPRSLNITNITATTATLNWTITGGNGSYTIVYGPTGFTPGGTGSQSTPAAAGATSGVISGLTANTPYQAYITQNCGGTAGNSTRSGPVAFTTLPVPATNDDCANAINVPVTTACTSPITGTVLGATQSVAATASCGSAPTTANDVWYRFTASTASQIVTVAGQFGGVIEVRSGNCTTSTTLGCTTFSSGMTAAPMSVAGLTANQQYYIRIYPNSSTAPAAASSTFTLCVTPGPTAPANDDCAGAQTLQVSNGNTCTTRTRFSLDGATGSFGVPAPGCASYGGGDVWFRVTVPANGALTMETDSVAGSNISDTGMALYSGTCGNLTLIECDDDDSPNGLFSMIDRTGLTPGNVLYIRVWQYGNVNPTGRMAICVRSITPPPPPTNDECATAISIQSTPTCTTTNGYVTGATQSLPTTSGCGSATSANDVWYSFTAVSASQDILLNPQFSAVMQVYSGACANLTSINCGTVSIGNSTARTVTGLTPGQTYYIRVFANVAPASTAQGVFTLCIKPAPGSCATPTAPAASAITATSVTLSWAGTLGTGESFSVLYGPRGFTNGTTINNINATTYQLNGLTPDTDYCFFISKNCGAQLGQSTATAETCFRTLIAVPLNDDPCGAPSLAVNASGQLTQTTGTTSGATTSSVGNLGASLPACSPALGPKDVWYRVTMPAGQTSLTVALSGSAAGMVRIYTAANCSTSFTLVNCRAASGPNTAVGTQTFTGLTAGTTYYIAVSGYGTADTGGSFVIGSVVASARALQGSELSVFPNPAHGGQLTLNLKGAGKATSGEAALINALGQVVRKQTISIHNGAAEQQLNIDGLSRGLYTLRISAAGGAVTRSVVIE